MSVGPGPVAPETGQTGLGRLGGNRVRGLGHDGFIGRLGPGPVIHGLQHLGLGHEHGGAGLPPALQLLDGPQGGRIILLPPVGLDKKHLGLGPERVILGNAAQDRHRALILMPLEIHPGHLQGIFRGLRLVLQGFQDPAGVISRHQGLEAPGREALIQGPQPQGLVKISHRGAFVPQLRGQGGQEDEIAGTASPMLFLTVLQVLQEVLQLAALSAQVGR